MGEIFKVMLNYKEAGVALFFALLFYMDMRKKVDKLDGHVRNDVLHGLTCIKNAIDNQTELLDRKLK